MPRTIRLPHKLSEMVQGEGIFFGIGYLNTDPKVKQGDTGKYVPYKMFAAPELLPATWGGALCASLTATFDRMAQLENWHGHNGLRMTSRFRTSGSEFGYWDSTLRHYILEGKYNGEWVVPPIEVVDGCLADHVYAGRREMQIHFMLKALADLKDTWTCSHTTTAAWGIPTQPYAIRQKEAVRANLEANFVTRPVRFVPLS